MLDCSISIWQIICAHTRMLFITSYWRLFRIEKYDFMINFIYNIWIVFAYLHLALASLLLQFLICKALKLIILIL